MILTFVQLKILWWLLIGVLFAGVFVMDGMVCGALMLMPFISKNDAERRVVLNSVGPIWEGNQVWLILAGGALFAAWPMVYAVLCSAFYLAVFLLLLSLILRPAGFKLRGKLDALWWHNIWDTCLFLGGLLPALLLGVVVGNLMVGITFTLDSNLMPNFGGSFFSLLGPVPLLFGIINVMFSIRQGSIYLCSKMESHMVDHARRVFNWSTLVLLALVSSAIFLVKGLDGYVVTSAIDFAAQPNPLGKTVSIVKGAWANRYATHSWLYVFPGLCFAGLLLSQFLLSRVRTVYTFFASALAVIGALFSVGAGIYPFILPSKVAPSDSLLVWDASSSGPTLHIMTVVVLIFLPCVLAYTAWVYKVFNYRLSSKDIVNALKNEVY